jgi:hypothetical protein
VCACRQLTQQEGVALVPQLLCGLRPEQQLVRNVLPSQRTATLRAPNPHKTLVMPGGDRSGLCKLTVHERQWVWQRS